MLYEGLIDEVMGELPACTRPAVAELDVLAAFAERAETLALCRPELVAAPEITIEGGRHPVVERVQETAFVPNDLRRDEARRMLIITGPNMGGSRPRARLPGIACRRQRPRRRCCRSDREHEACERGSSAPMFM